MIESVLKQSVKNVIEDLEGTGADFQELIEEERVGKNRKSMIGWLEKQGAQRPTPEADSTVDASAPEVESVYAEPSLPVESPEAPLVDFLAKGVLEYGESEYAISVLIAILSEKRDMIQRSTSCGLENIRVHLAGIKITVR